MAKKAVGSTLGLALTLAMLPTEAALAQGILPAPNGTNTQVIINGNQFDIRGGSLSADQLNLFHRFQEFGLTEGQIANFLANPRLRNIISTVDGGNPSIINGLLQVTGGNPNLFLMNPSGIIFGPNAQLNVPTSFSAITADGIQFGDRWLNATGPNDYSSLIGNPTAFRFSSDFAGAIVNAGNLQVNPGAALSLMGGTVINTGQLTASQGQILITAVPGESLVRLALPGYILNLEVDVPLVTGNTPQTWQLPMTALPTLLTQGLTPELLGLAINASGGVQLANGTPVPNLPGTAMVAGGVDVSGNRGGTVAVLGDRVGLVGAQIDASGTQGGGQIRVGGDYQGAGTLPNAQRTYVDANTTIAADALTTGNGGRIIIWADEATGFYSDITARGGQRSGDGGFAEVSGRDYLQFDGTADLSSVNGEIGTLLLDPENIIISNQVSDSPGLTSNLGDNILEISELQNINPVTISQATLENLSGAIDIYLGASNDIIIRSLDVQTDQNGTVRPVLEIARGNGDITFEAGRDFLMPIDALLQASSNASSDLNSLNSDRTLTIQATRNIVLGDITTRGGNTPGGNVVIRASGNIQTGDIATFADFDQSRQTTNPYSAGSITISGIPGINNGLPDSIDTSRGQLAAGAAQGSGNDITLSARGNITTALIGTSSVDGGDNTRAGNITIFSESGNIDISRSAPGIVPPFDQGQGLSAGFISGSGGAITIDARQGQVVTSSISSGARINGGSINIESPKIIVRGDLTTSIFAEPDPARPDIIPRSDRSGNIELQGNVILEGNSSIDSRTLDGSNSGNIIVRGNINSEFSSPRNLTLDSGRGTVQINGPIGNVSPIGDLTVSSQETSLFGSVRTVNRPITFNSPITLNSNSPLTFNSGTAAITLNGLNAGNTPLTLIASDFNFSGTLRGNNTLTIQPSPSSPGITLGNTVDDTLNLSPANLSPAEIAGLRGFSNVTIGGSGDITVNAPVTFNTPTQLNTTGNINVSGNITTTGQNLTFGSNINLGQDVTLSTGTGVGNLSFLGTITGQPHRLTLEAGTGSILLPRQVNVRQFNVNSAQTLFLGAGITTANTPLTFNVPVVLTQNAALRTGTPGANITFGNTLNSEAGENNNLNLAAGGGDISINGAVGNTQPLGNVAIESVNALTTNAPIQAGSFQQTGTPATGDIALNQPITTTNGGVNLTTTGAVTTGAITTNGGGIAISGNTVDSSALITSTGGISVVGAGTVAITNATSNGGGIAVTSNNGSVQANTLNTTAGGITVGAEGNVAVTNATATGGDINLSSNNGSVQANTLSATGGDVEVTAPGEVVVPTVRGDNGVVLTSTGSSVQTTNVTTNDGDVTLDAQTNLAVNNVTTNGGDITLRSRADTITVNILSSASGTGSGGNITVLNPNAITATGPIDASGATTGGNICLSGSNCEPGTPDDNKTGTVTTGNLTATGVDGGLERAGGDITVLARDSITAGEIDTSATVGNGGNVLLDPLGDVQVTFINAQGGTNGAGGNVEIESVAQFFRATGAFTDQNGILASISAAGGGGEGTMRITHNGGAADVLVPFIISTASDNGTVGALTTGANNIIFPGSFLGPYTQGNIDIITSPQATQLADSSLPDTLPEEIQPAETDNQPFWLDDYFTRRTEDYLGINGETRVKSLEEIQDELQRIEDATGVKPALIYVVFEPEVVLRTIQEEGQMNPEDMVNQGSLMRLEPSDHLQLILVTADGQPILRRPNDERAVGSRIPTEVEQLRQKILEDFSDYLVDGITLPDRYLSSAQLLYQWLVEPLLADLEDQEIENLVFIMDTGLRSTPLAALPVMHDGTSFIVENYSVGLMPSFSLTDTRIEDIRNSQVLAMGMADFSEHSEFNDLLAVRDEIGLITQRLWPSVENNLDNLLDDEFTPSVLTSRRRRQPAGIVHLATHTKFNSEEPGDSFIIFADNQLSFDDFRSLEFANPPVELLVLSSCTTALSAEDDRAELGFAGISVQAGVKSSLASLWEVNDVGTLGLMVEFYSQLQTAPIKAIALQEAQLAMIRGNVFLEDGSLIWSSGDTYLSFSTASIPNTEMLSRHLFSHPGYWAGFTIIGNPW